MLPLRNSCCYVKRKNKAMSFIRDLGYGEKKFFPSQVMPTKTTQGLWWKFCSTTCFALISVIVSYAVRQGTTLKAPQIAFFQLVIPAVFMLGYIKPQSLKVTLLTQDPKNALLRSVCASVAFLSWFWAIMYLPLGLLMGVRVLGPLLTFLAAILFLRERTNTRQALALLGMIACAYFLLRREVVSKAWDVNSGSLLFILPLLTIFAYTAANIFGKRLMKNVAAREGALSLLCLNSLFLLGVAVFFWTWPTLYEWGWLILIGGLEGVGQWSLARALSLTPLTLLTPLSLWKFGLTTLLAMSFLGAPYRPLFFVSIGFMLILTPLALSRLRRD